MPSKQLKAFLTLANVYEFTIRRTLEVGKEKTFFLKISIVAPLQFLSNVQVGRKINKLVIDTNFKSL